MNTNRLVLCVAAAGLLLSGCSSQSDRDAAESTSAATSTTVAATSSSAAPESLSALATSPPAATPEAAPSVVESTPPPVSLPVAPPANSVPQPNAPIDARSPEEIVANAGEKGQRYIAALRLAGIPPAGMDSAEILYADGTCKALADGMPRSEVLAEFDSVGEVYSQITPMSSQRIAEIYVDTAQQTYC
ncbi:DUF732 domain-containing protein [Rhodococcus sp. IEGM 1318]|uniref:DUF732 domain-containing protein n=1 Tax=Rhodococcus sp. IEGM 1318 TaxID=3082226 RepID=UPI00295439AB|nr:DUF732 domain-containing protein [Rhodococcus sp. IEGM 1318]MDV8005769.1 DUF732 domain-containing protein [Rhodococcus sp. IEGM 1318]